MSKLFIEISKKKINEKKIRLEQEKKYKTFLFYEELKSLNHTIVYKSFINLYKWMFYIPDDNNLYILTNEIGNLIINSHDIKYKYTDGKYKISINDWYIQSDTNTNSIKNYKKDININIIEYIKDASECQNKTQLLIEKIETILKCDDFNKGYCEKCYLTNCNSKPNYITYINSNWIINSCLQIHINKINYKILLIIDNKHKKISDEQLLNFIKKNKNLIKEEFQIQRNNNIKKKKKYINIERLKNNKQILEKKSAIIIQTKWRKYKNIELSTIQKDCSRKVNANPNKIVNLFINRTCKELYEEQSCKKF